MTNSDAHYEPVIDGLRGIAIAWVVLFHAAPRVMPGGFVGVDIFFVISGFVITRLIVAQIETKKFRFINFFAARTLRLAPAGFFVLLATLPFAYFLFTPDHFRRLGESTAWTTLGAGNLFAWRDTSYFSPEAITKPLLHFWSLGVETQFYLFWPFAIALLLFYRRSPLLITGALLLMGAASLVASELWLHKNPPTSFYLTPLRLFEFALGALCVWIRPAQRAATAWFLFVCGACMILASGLLYRAHISFPGFAGLLPCLGTALVIIGRNNAGAKFLLANPLIVFVGTISYSLYLVHWPAIVFYEYWTFRPPSNLEIAALIAGTFLLSILLWRFVETPFRNRPSLRTNQKHWLFLGTAGAAILLVSVSTVIARQDGWPWRLDEQQQKWLSQIQPKYKAYCRQPQSERISENDCEFGSTIGKPEVALIGDSHAQQWMPGLDTLFKERGIKAVLFGVGGKLPFVGSQVFQNGKPGDTAFAEKIDDWISSKRPSLVILSARWSLYWHTHSPTNAEGPIQFKYKNLPNDTPEATQSSIRAALIETVERIHNRGIRVFLLGQIPELGIDSPSCLLRPIAGSNEESCRAFTREQAIDWQRPADKMLVDVSRKFPTGVDSLLPSEGMCKKDWRFCILIEGETLLYRDAHHLSAIGAIQRAPRDLKRILDSLPE